MSITPYAAAGMIEVAHQLGVLPMISEKARTALVAGLLGYGFASNQAAESHTQEQAEFLRNLEARIRAENAERQRQRDARFLEILANAQRAHNS